MLSATLDAANLKAMLFMPLNSASASFGSWQLLGEIADFRQRFDELVERRGDELLGRAAGDRSRQPQPQVARRVEAQGEGSLAGLRLQLRLAAAFARGWAGRLGIRTVSAGCSTATASSTGSSS